MKVKAICNFAGDSYKNGDIFEVDDIEGNRLLSIDAVVLIEDSSESITEAPSGFPEKIVPTVDDDQSKDVAPTVEVANPQPPLVEPVSPAKTDQTKIEEQIQNDLKVLDSNSGTESTV